MLNREQVLILKEKYQPGDRVELIEMGEDMQKLKAGSTGTIKKVDDIGTIHVNWDQGSSLGLVVGEDKFKVTK